MLLVFNIFVNDERSEFGNKLSLSVCSTKNCIERYCFGKLRPMFRESQPRRPHIFSADTKSKKNNLRKYSAIRTFTFFEIECKI